MKILLDVAYYISILTVLIIYFVEPSCIGLIIASCCAAVISITLLIISKRDLIKKISVALALTLFPIFIFKVDAFASIFFFSIITYFLGLITEFKMRKPFEK